MSQGKVHLGESAEGWDDLDLDDVDFEAGMVDSTTNKDTWEQQALAPASTPPTYTVPPLHIGNVTCQTSYAGDKSHILMTSQEKGRENVEGSSEDGGWELDEDLDIGSEVLGPRNSGIRVEVEQQVASSGFGVA